MQLKEIERIIRNRLGIHILSSNMYDEIRKDILKIISVPEAIDTLKEHFEIEIAQLSSGKRVVRLTEKHLKEKTEELITHFIKIDKHMC